MLGVLLVLRDDLLQGLQGLLVHGERFGELALLPVDLLVQALHVLDQGLHVLRPPEASEIP